MKSIEPLICITAIGTFCLNMSANYVGASSSSFTCGPRPRLFKVCPAASISGHGEGLKLHLLEAVKRGGGERGGGHTVSYAIPKLACNSHPPWRSPAATTDDGSGVFPPRASLNVTRLSPELDKCK